MLSTIVIKLIFCSMRKIEIYILKSTIKTEFDILLSESFKKIKVVLEKEVRDSTAGYAKDENSNISPIKLVLLYQVSFAGKIKLSISIAVCAQNFNFKWSVFALQ